MLFNSFEFLLFFPVVTLLYFWLPNRFRWFHLLMMSCVFYMAFVPIYILILFFTIIVDYIAGIYIEQSNGKLKKLFLVISLIVNIGILAFFKYYNFFVDNINILFDSNFSLLKIILPIGLSFHTFQAMSYTIEVYKGRQRAERHLGIYALYVMFYPQLVAGPVERPQNILHQFREEHKFDTQNFIIGIRLILWGLFKKIVIADRMGIYVNGVYDNINGFGFWNILLVLPCFAIQIYCDFSGYSDIAIGAAKSMGFDLIQNFNLPLLESKNISDYWRRWHISLSTWFNDYLYTPIALALRNWGESAIYFGLMITFTISGLWHGADWHYIIYGMINGVAIIFEMLTKKQRKKLSKTMSKELYNILSKVLTFITVCFFWVFFRANTMKDALVAYKKLLTFDCAIPFQGVVTYNNGIFSSLSLLIGLVAFIFVFFIERKSILNLSLSDKKNSIDIAFHICLLAGILMLGSFNQSAFIYFQF